MKKLIIFIFLSVNLFGCADKLTIRRFRLINQSDYNILIQFFKENNNSKSRRIDLKPDEIWTSTSYKIKPGNELIQLNEVYNGDSVTLIFDNKKINSFKFNGNHPPISIFNSDEYKRTFQDNDEYLTYTFTNADYEIAEPIE